MQATKDDEAVLDDPMQTEKIDTFAGRIETAVP